ncbi:hypothetical protein SAMN04489760_10848 [Syntrophus gentianae]|uniref:Uncharacterized protein n=1 Tax=Syntrophus gentianae TaxID=43775 RepID=A0A1H7WXJ1_9BACT|nr:hypothetical protein SAMN04489760_10848 [Syntrophus gentianae]
MDQTNLSGRKEFPRSRRKRLFGMTDSILSNMTVYLNPYQESDNNLSVEEAALFDVVNRAFNKRDS